MNLTTIVLRSGSRPSCARSCWFSAGCGTRSHPEPDSGPIAVPPFGGEELPPDEAVAQVEKAKGGTIALDDGAQVTLPPESPHTGRDGVRSAPRRRTPGVPVPSSIIGRAYELALEGADMSGRRPNSACPCRPASPPTNTHVTPYRWTGRLWERVTGPRCHGRDPVRREQARHLCAARRRWRLADAALALVKPETLPGQQSIPLTVVGQYRYLRDPGSARRARARQARAQAGLVGRRRAGSGRSRAWTRPSTRRRSTSSRTRRRARG